MNRDSGLSGHRRVYTSITLSASPLLGGQYATGRGGHRAAGVGWLHGPEGEDEAAEVPGTRRRAGGVQPVSATSRANPAAAVSRPPGRAPGTVPRRRITRHRRSCEGRRRCPRARGSGRGALVVLAALLHHGEVGADLLAGRASSGVFLRGRRGGSERPSRRRGQQAFGGAGAGVVVVGVDSLVALGPAVVDLRVHRLRDPTALGVGTDIRRLRAPGEARLRAGRGRSVRRCRTPVRRGGPGRPPGLGPAGRVWPVSVRRRS